MRPFRFAGEQRQRLAMITTLLAVSAALGCEAWPAEPTYSPLAESKPAGTLRIETPNIPLLAERGFAVVRACTQSNCYALIASVRLGAPSTDVILAAGDYSVEFLPPSGFSLQGTPGSAYQYIRVTGAQITTATYAGTLVTIVPPAPPTAAFGMLFVDVSGLGSEVADGGTISGGSEVYVFPTTSVPKSGTLSMPVPVGHWMDHYYYLSYKPPAGYSVAVGDSARYDVWFYKGDSTTTWRVAVTKSK